MKAVGKNESIYAVTMPHVWRKIPVCGAVYG